MTQLPLEVYRIDMKYIRNLHNIDDRIFSVSPQIVTNNVVSLICGRIKKSVRRDYVRLI